MQAIFRLHGQLLIGLACAMLLPMMVELYRHTQDWQIYALSSLGTGFIGIILCITNQIQTINKRYIFLFTTSVWLITPLFAALPFIFTTSEYPLNLSDAVFETISGLTTTGSTVITHLDETPYGLLLWRSLLQWIGGIGIVVMAMVILPQLGIGGMQLLRSESSDKSDQTLPRARQVARATFSIYIFLTCACTVTYYVAGMSGFDAINHAMTAISTGGFSTHDKSIMHYNSLLIENITSLFMFLGGIPLMLYFSIFMGKKPNSILLSQTQAYSILCLITALLFIIWLLYNHLYDYWTAISHAIFTIISIITTTGYTAVDYTGWGNFIIIMVYFLTIVGGCTGSTSGGIKIFRFQVIFTSLKSDMFKMLHPNGVFIKLIGGKSISANAELSVKMFFIMFCIAFSIITLLLSLTGLDIITSMSASATAISNVGPGLGAIIGPTGNFASLPNITKWILAFGMVLGRLEILTVLVILNRYFWRD